MILLTIIKNLKILLKNKNFNIYIEPEYVKNVFNLISEDVDQIGEKEQ